MLLILNRILFLIINHPLTLGFILITQTFLISLFTGIFTIIYWFSYSLFLVFIGGMLVLFMYITSLASNETFYFKINFKKLNISIILLTILFIIFIFKDWKNILINNKIINKEIFNFSTFINLSQTNYLLLNKIYNFPINIITILLVNYLFLTLVATVKITNIFKGPLRPKNN